ncbi:MULTISPECIES: cation diffusion facilitator family transporter [Shewanella]|uniref:Cation diffusion facilitator family transporter n=1 Tax=Shewanella indica TaxID=768528 RepID=A0ABU4QB28_9GAMM|nr:MULTISPECIES: cation diffusion facilitator family transporter [Shewanella]OIN16955.1 cation transporter [Shewanella algae]BCV38634.1 cation transporter [Shewanella chilikensis]MCE9792848.1 cation diffusion facilitator family transporter [Shewanella indica]MDX6016011.1 cation diffusion facilitator family transporter [Shewanella indica]NDO74884.1 cation transporter [Shewanella sp. SE1]
MSRKARAAMVSVCSNISLIIMKVAAGIVSGSVSIISEAIHSAMDLVAALIALFAVRRADVPPDWDHPYGHDKIENVSGVIEALLILAAAGWIIFEAVGKLLSPSEVEGLGWGVLVMLLSALVNTGVSAYLYRVAREEQSVALEADALHLKADVLTSLGVAVGLLLIWVGGYFGHNLALLDPIVAIGVALFILKEAISMLDQAFKPLLDHSISEEELNQAAEIIAHHCPSEGGFHDLRGRQAGRRRHIDFHLTLPKEMSVGHSHAICDRIEQALMAVIPHAAVFIHVEPLEEQPEEEGLLQQGA